MTHSNKHASFNTHVFQKDVVLPQMNLSPIQNNCLQEVGVVGDGGVSTPHFSFLPRLTIRLCHFLGVVISHIIY